MSDTSKAKSASSLELDRSRRIRKRRDFLRLQRRGVRVSCGAITFLGRPTQMRPGDGRIGLTVPKKVGNAPVRNLIKRRLRHIARENWSAIRGLDVVVIAKPFANSLCFTRLKSDFFRASKILRQKTAKNN